MNLGNATGHLSRIMDGSFTNQVLAQMHLWEAKFADLSENFGLDKSKKNMGSND